MPDAAHTKTKIFPKQQNIAILQPTQIITAPIWLTLQLSSLTMGDNCVYLSDLMNTPDLIEPLEWNMFSGADSFFCDGNSFSLISSNSNIIDDASKGFLSSYMNADTSNDVNKTNFRNLLKSK